MWNNTLAYTIAATPDTDVWAPYPNVKAWHDRMAAREAVKKTLARQTEQGKIEDEAMAAAAAKKE
jgi:glutathione S-transferase